MCLAYFLYVSCGRKGSLQEDQERTDEQDGHQDFGKDASGEHPLVLEHAPSVLTLLDLLATVARAEVVTLDLLDKGIPLVDLLLG